VYLYQRLLYFKVKRNVLKIASWQICVRQHPHCFNTHICDCDDPNIPACIVRQLSWDFNAPVDISHSAGNYFKGFETAHIQTWEMELLRIHIRERHFSRILRGCINLTCHGIPQEFQIQHLFHLQLTAVSQLQL